MDSCACTLGSPDKHAHLRPDPVPADALLTPFGNPGGCLTGGGGGIAACGQAVTPEPVCDDETAASPPLISSLRKIQTIEQLHWQWENGGSSCTAKCIP